MQQYISPFRFAAFCSVELHRLDQHGLIYHYDRYTIWPQTKHQKINGFLSMSPKIRALTILTIENTHNLSTCMCEVPLGYRTAVDYT